MTRSRLSSLVTHARARDPINTAKPRDSAARMAGIFLLLTAAATVVMVFARVSADADHPSLSDTMVAIAQNRAMYSLSGAARVLSAVTLMAAAWYLLKTWIIRERLGAPLVPYLFLASGIFTAVSGVLALALAATAPEVSDPNIRLLLSQSTETTADVRWITGKIGFTLMGLALIVAARYQWKAGGPLRYVAVASAVIGIAMQFIWLDAATIMHIISGVAVFVWLLVIGVLLTTGRVERQFAAQRASN